MLQVNSVTKQFGDFTAVRDINFQVEPSSIYGLVGYNGAGKTTLLKVIAGIYQPEKGGAFLNGEPVYENPNIKSQMFFIPDEVYAPVGTTMKKMAKFYKSYYPDFNQPLFEKLATAFDLDVTKRMQGFSKGMARLAEIAFAMATEPKLLLLDESFDGLDPKKRNTVKQLLMEYICKSECSIIISSHNLTELESLCDHVGLINGKSLVVDEDISSLGDSHGKYRIVFNGAVDKSNFDKFDTYNFKLDGNVVSFGVRGNVAEIREQIDKMNPILVDETIPTLEEIFLNQLGETELNISDFFNNEKTMKV